MKDGRLSNLTKPMAALAWLVTFIALPLVVSAQTSQLPLLRPRHHVSDFAKVIDSPTTLRIENVLANLKKRTGINFIVVTTETVGKQDLYTHSLSAANEWNIGSPASDEKSVLLFISTDTGRFFTLCSRGVESGLPDGVIGVMGRNMRPKFEAKNYSLGLETGIKTFVDILGWFSNFTFAALDQQVAMAPQLASFHSAGFIRKPPLREVDDRVELPDPLTWKAKDFASGEVKTDSPRAESIVPTGIQAKLSESSLAIKSSSAGRNSIMLPPEKAAPVRIARLRSRPVIDGRLDDEIWKQATVLTDFYQVQPGDNIEASQPTKVLLGYDEKFLYVAFRAHDDPERVRATKSGRDQIFDDDTVGMYLDTFNDQRQAYQFFFNPLGVQADAILLEGQGTDASVDIVMESKGSINTEGYIVEVAIPFKSLNYPAGGGKTWGVHFQRRIKRLNNELDSWMPLSRDRSGFLNQQGHLTGFEGISTERMLEIIPTLTISERGRNVRSAGNTGSNEATRFVNQAPRFRPGLTLKYGLKPNLKAGFTLYPDFADVEADQTVITANQRFPIFFAEKRPFFLEGIEVFRTPLQAVHTRAIIEPDFAAKITGKVGQTTLGVLVASDAAPGNYSEEEQKDPAKKAIIGKFLDENAYVAVLRLKRDIGGESSLGMIATSYNFIEKHNHLAGFDGRFRLDPQSVFSFQVLGTTSRRFFYDPESDNRTYRTGNGFGYFWNFERSQRHFYLGFSGQGRTRDYISDLGFTRRTNTNSKNLFISYNSEPRPEARLISWQASNSLSTKFDWQGRSQDWDNYSEIQFNFSHETFLSFAVDRGYERLFEEEFGARRTATNEGTFFGNDSERSTQRRSISVSGGSTPNQKYSIYAFFSRNWGAFDYDYGAGPRFARVSPAALIDPNALLDPGAGTSSDIAVYLTYQPTQELRTSFNYTRSKLVRNDTRQVAFSDQIYSLNADYRFTRFLFARARVDYDWLSANVLGQMLLGWTPNPGTSVYVGYNDNLSYHIIDPPANRFAPGLRRNERVFFVKMSYLIRRSVN